MKINRPINRYQRQGVSDSFELNRILALPRRKIDLNSIQDLTPIFKLPEGILNLWPIQSAALLDMEKANGGFYPIGVGHGKTLISLLAGDVLHAKKTVVLVEPQLRDKILKYDIPYFSKHFRLPEAYILAYSELSSASKAECLEIIRPDLIVADEAHNLKHKDSARTKRFLRYMKEHPECRFVALSGTMTSKSIKDYAHLIELCLKKNSPLPNGWHELNDWADALDVAPINPVPPGALLKLCEPGEPARSGFRRRLVETPGVVATEEGALGTSLIIAKRDISISSIVAQALTKLRKTWTIAKEELEDTIALYRVARQLACGFYYCWKWANGEADHEWLRLRAEWHKEIRHTLHFKSRSGLDSPLLVSQAFSRGELSSSAWNNWQKVKNRPIPDVQAVWVDEFLVKDAIKWGKEGGIIWVEHRAVGEKIKELSHFPYFGEGELASKTLNSCTDRTIVCSIKAHGTGKNLQRWNRNLIVTPPSNGKTWEQMIGRTHRPGQEADQVSADVYLHTSELLAAYSSALESAKYIEETQGQKQKLLYATRLV